MTRDFLWQPMFTMKGVTSQSVVQPANEWLDTRGAQEVAVRCEVLNISSPVPTFQLQTGPSADGPWTNAYTTQTTEKVTVVLSNDPNATYKIERYVRWRIEAPATRWSTTFQITACGQSTRSTVKESYTTSRAFAGQTSGLVAKGPGQLVTKTIDVTTGKALSAPREVAGQTRLGSAPSRRASMEQDLLVDEHLQEESVPFADLAPRRAGGADGVIQPWTTVVGAFAATGDDIVIASEDNWIPTRGMEQLYIKAEMLECCPVTYSVDLIIEKAMSREGPWTTVLTVNTAYSVQNVSLSSEDSASNKLENYVRWHIYSQDTTWKTCFRINGRQWP
jgi:hypothetical protein